MRWTEVVALALALGLLTGCAGTRAERTLRTDGPRMVELFRGGGAAAEEEVAPARAPAAGCGWLRRVFRGCADPSGTAADAAPATGRSGYVDYTRTARNELELLFPRLPNPDILIYVLPHLATEARVPVPGYTTAVPLYERVEYALPGELEAVE